MEALVGEDPVKVAELLIPMLQADIPDDLHDICMDILQQVGVCISLEGIRQDHWFDELKAEADPQNIEIVSQIVGKRYFAYSILLGLQIQSLKQTADPNLARLSDDSLDEGGMSKSTLVEFTSDSEMIQKLPLEQFNLQVASVLLGIGVNATRHCTLPLTAEQALSIIGEMPLLVAPLFDIFPTHLAAVQKGSLFKCIIGLSTPKGRAFLSIEEFDKLVLQLLRFDVQRYGQERLTFDFDTTSATAAFNRGDYQQVIHLLETWPGLLSTMLKTPAQKELNETQLARIASGCRLLSGAFRHMGETEFAMEVIRLAIRYTADTEFVAPLYLEMGALLNHEERFGEALAFLRRATVLDPESATGWASLGKALRHQHRLIAAWIALREAQSLGAAKFDDHFIAPAETVRNETDAQIEILRKAFKDAQLVWPR